MEYTEKLQLKKPQRGANADPLDVNDLNYNFDKIDEAFSVSDVKETKKELPAASATYKNKVIKISSTNEEFRCIQLKDGRYVWVSDRWNGMTSIYKCLLKLTDWKKMYSNSCTKQNLTFNIPLVYGSTSTVSLAKKEDAYTLVVISDGKIVLNIVYNNLADLKTSKYVTVGKSFVESTFTNIKNAALVEGSLLYYQLTKTFTGIKLRPSIMTYTDRGITEKERDANKEGYGTIIDFENDQDNDGYMTKMIITVSELTSNFSIGIVEEMLK